MQSYIDLLTILKRSLWLRSHDAGTFLKTVKNMMDRPPVHTKTANFLQADFENCRF